MKYIFTCSAIEQENLEDIADDLEHIAMRLREGGESGFVPSWEVRKEGEEVKTDESAECTHEEYENGACVGCGQIQEDDDFSGATPGDR